MKLRLFKMHGCGNDFLFVDALKAEAPPLSPQTIRAACDRHFGVGADGIAILQKGAQTDARWKFYNCDGSEAEMCGNAARCAVLYLLDRHFPDRDWITLDTVAGVIKGRRADEGRVRVTLTVPGGAAAEYEEKTIKFKDAALRIFCINTGVPHAVIDVKNIREYPIREVGSFLVGHPVFDGEGSNVTFIQKHMANEIFCTTFERGVESETYACGTGVAAGALVYSQLYAQELPIRVNVPGGTLEVDASEDPDTVTLTGPAAYVMELDWLGTPTDYAPHELFGREISP